MLVANTNTRENVGPSSEFATSRTPRAQGKRLAIGKMRTPNAHDREQANNASRQMVQKSERLFVRRGLRRRDCRRVLTVKWLRQETKKNIQAVNAYVKTMKIGFNEQNDRSINSIMSLQTQQCRT